MDTQHILDDETRGVISYLANAAEAIRTEAFDQAIERLREARAGYNWGQATGIDLAIAILEKMRDED